MPSNPNNNTAQTAKAIAIAGSSTSVELGSLSAAVGGDLVDYYQFTTSAVSNLDLTLDLDLRVNPTGSPRLKVFQVGAGGALGSELASNISNSTIATNNSGLLAESFIFNGLAAGTYLIRVDLGDNPASTAVADYFLSGLASVDGVSTSIAWRSPGSTPLAFWKMNGTTYQESGPQVGGYEIIGTGDFDGDRTTDLIWRESGVVDSLIAIWLLNADNTIKSQQFINRPGESGTRINAAVSLSGVHDLTGDGKADLIWRDSGGNTSFWTVDGTTVVDVVNRAIPGFEVVGYGDFNADNRTDVMWRNAAGQVAVWLLNGGQTLPGTGFVNAPQAMTSRYTALGVGNLNASVGGSTTTAAADRRSDVVWYDNLTGEVLLWTMNGAQVSLQTKSSPVLPSSGWVFTATGDVSGEGNMDIVWRNTFSGAVGLWLLEGNGIRAADFPDRPIPGGFYIEGLADLNSDGAQDLLWRWNNPNPLFGDSVAVWLMGAPNSVNGEKTKTRAEAFYLNPGVTNPDFANWRRMPASFKARFLTTQFARVDQATAGSTAATAFNMGVLNGEGNYQDSVIPDTPAAPVTDFYKFKLERTTKTNIDLLGTFNGTTSTTAAFRISREVIGTNGEVTLAAFAFTPGQTLAPGVYYIEVKTAPTVVNQLVNYNLKVKGEPISVNLLGDGLIVRDSTNTVDTAVTLANLTGRNTPTTPAKVEYKIKNTEISNSSPVKVRFYISRDQTIDLGVNSRDVLIGEKTYTGANNAGVPANTTITDVADVNLPAGDNVFWTTDGDYYVGMVIDPVSASLPQGELFETNETDNLNQGLLKDVDLIRINNTQIPDLLMTQISGPATITRGATAPTTIAVNYTVRNAGKRSTGSINPDVGLNFYIYAQNPDTNLTIEQRNLLETSSPLTKPLASGNGNFLVTEDVGAETNVSEPVILTIPALTDPYWSQFAAGTVFFIGSVLDQGNTFTESDEANNLNRGLGLDRFQVTVQ